jgi:hypothetical protein
VALGQAAGAASVTAAGTTDAIGTAWGAVSAPLRPARGVALYSGDPTNGGPALRTAESRDGSVFVGLFGYVIPSDLRALADGVASEGVDAAVARLDGGGFGLVVVERRRGRCTVVGDPLASVPLYLAATDGGALLSTNPVSLARCPGVDRTPDLVAMAEWLYLGYALGPRFFVRGIRTLGIGEAHEWDPVSGTGTLRLAHAMVRNAPADVRDVEPGAVVEIMRAACRRIAESTPRPAHLQSAGLDSRFIAACWPRDVPLPSYTYGDPEALEPRIARQITAVRGDPYTHHFADGDMVAGVLDTMFAATGLLVYPDRHVIGEVMQRDGRTGVLDGWAGGVLLGGQFAPVGHHLPRRERYLRRLGRWRDEQVSAYHGDQLAEWMLREITEHSPDAALPYLSPAFAALMHEQWPAVLADLHSELEQSTHPTGSLELTWRTFKIRNRSAHSILQQAVLGREFADVFTPYGSDRDMVGLLLSLHPSVVAHRRLYHRIFRECLPRYAAVPWGSSLLPFSRPLVQHWASQALIARGKRIPGITGDTHGRQRDPNGWAVWLKQSGELRQAAAAPMRSAGAWNEGEGDRWLEDVAAGRARGGGKLFHVSAIARWLA